MKKSANAVTTYLAEDVAQDFDEIVVPHYRLSKAAVLETLVRDAALNIKGEQTKGKQLSNLITKAETLLEQNDMILTVLAQQARTQQIVMALLWAVVIKNDATGIVKLDQEQVRALAQFARWANEQQVAV